MFWSKTGGVTRGFRGVAVVGIAVLGLILAGTLSAMIKEMPVAELVRASDFVVIAVVEDRAEVSVNSEQISTVKNTLKLERAIKGEWRPADPIVVFTQQRGSYGEIGSLEDQVEFPAKGQRVLLFLRQLAPGRVDLVNTLQGMWPMDGKTLHGFGTGITLDSVVETVKQQQVN